MSTSGNDAVPVADSRSCIVGDAETNGPSYREEPLTSASTRPGSNAYHVPDKGRAWLIVLAGVINEGISWGFAVSYGVFQDYYTNVDGPFQGDERLPMVGVLSTGVLYLGLPVMSPITTRFLARRRQFVAVGLMIQIASLIAASFACNTPTLIGTQGFLFAFGFVVLYMPLISLTNEWFDKRRGLAYGFIYGSTGLTGIPLPFILEKLLYNYGAATTLRAYAVVLVILAGPTVFLVQPRIATVDTGATFTIIKPYSFLMRRKTFYLYCVSSLFQGLGAYFPALFLPEYSTDLGMKTIVGAAMIVLYCFGQATGQVIFGALSDRVEHLDPLILLSSLPPGVTTFFLWGFGKTAAPLAVYALIFGLCAPAYTVLFARMGTTLSKDSDTILASYAVLMALKGLGNILEGPLSQPLKSGQVVKDRYASGAYARMVWFTGGCMVLSALVVFPLVKWRRIFKTKR